MCALLDAGRMFIRRISMKVATLGGGHNQVSPSDSNPFRASPPPAPPSLPPCLLPPCLLPPPSPLPKRKTEFQKKNSVKTFGQNFRSKLSVKTFGQNFRSKRYWDPNPTQFL